MRRIAAIATAFALLTGAIAVAAPASAATVWTFPDASFTVSDGTTNTTGTISYNNLRIEGANATGQVRASALNWNCSTRAFSGLSAQFTLDSYSPCEGSVSFSVDPSGTLTVTSALKISYLPFTGAVGTAQAQAPTPVPLTGCTATLNDAAKQVVFTQTGSNPDATEYLVEVQPSSLPAQLFEAKAVPFELDVDYQFLASGVPVTATISAKRSDGMTIATCTTGSVTPWLPPGQPTIDSTVPVNGGLVTVNYFVANPTSVQGIEYQIDGGSWNRPGGTAPTGGVGGSFTVIGLDDGQHTITLRSIGLDPKPLTTDSGVSAFNIPAPPKKPSGTSRPSQSAAAVAIGSSPTKPVAAPPAAPVSSVAGTSNGAGTGTNGALAANTGDAGIDAPCLAKDGTLYPNQYSTVGSQLTMAPNTRGLTAVRAFTVTGGALPPGVQLDRTYGVLYGVTTQQGSWVTTVQATLADGSTKSSQFTTRVDADPQTLQYAAQNIGVVGSRVAIAPSTNAPAVGTTYALVCGELPAGTTFDTRTGAITGTPTTVVDRPTPLRVAETNASGKAAASFLFVVQKSGFTAISYPAHPHLRAGKATRIRPTVNGVDDIALFRMWKGKLQRGLRLNSTTGIITGRPLHGGPTHTITIVAVTKGGALLTSTPMRLRVQR